MTQGLFISFEGIDGSGKSTQAQLLAQSLRDAGRDVLLTREPGGSAGAEDIRRLLLEGEQDRWSPKTELLLFNAARLDHLEKTIRPALAAHKIVICDRFADSTRVYQGMARQGLHREVEAIHTLMIGQEPDITVLIDIAAHEGLRRALKRSGAPNAPSPNTSHTPPPPARQDDSLAAHSTREELRFETMGLEMLTRARQGFRDLAAQAPQRFRVIDGGQSPHEVAARVAWALQPMFEAAL